MKSEQLLRDVQYKQKIIDAVHVIDLFSLKQCAPVVIVFSLHQLYEGLKAYYGVDGKIRIFRPTMNMERMKITAERATLPYVSPSPACPKLGLRLSDWLPWRCLYIWQARSGAKGFTEIWNALKVKNGRKNAWDMICKGRITGHAHST